MNFDDIGFVPFTRGAWSADDAMVYSTQAHKTIVEPEGRPPTSERAATLALIAQAPAMYELLKELLSENDQLEDKIVPVLMAARIKPHQRHGG